MVRAVAKNKLSFKDGFTKVASGELVKRLQVLHKELASLEQDNIDTTSLNKVSRELIGRNLLLSKDKGVKSYVACCLADLLRLYAPDAPYTGPELKDIFDFFIVELKNLTGPSCPNFHQYFYLIESLSNVKSAVLICEVPGAEKLIDKTFKQFFELARPDLPKNALACLADILTQLIEEAQSLPPEVIDTLLAQFLPKHVRTNPSATFLAVEVCSSTSDKLQRYIAQYFTDVILNAVVDDEVDVSDDEEGRPKKIKKPSTPASIADSQDFIVAHKLIESINRTCPPLLTNVIPQLEAELVAEDIGIRALATKTLGNMFADKPLVREGSLITFMPPSTRSDLARKFPATWRAWLGRAKDKAPQVRIIVLEICKDILVNHHELGRDIYETLRLKLTDPDERIRAAACAAFSLVDYEAALHSLDKSLLAALADRIQDRKAPVQKEALQSLGKMYNRAFGEIANGERAAIDRFAWIPQEILRALSLPERELVASAEKVMHEQILPLPTKVDEEVQWVDRVLLILQHLDVPSQKLLFRFARLQEKKPSMFVTYLDIVEKYNGGIIDTNEEKIISQLKMVCRVLASTFPDSQKAEQDFQKFAKLNENRLLKLLRSLMDPASDLRSVIKNHSETIRRFEASSPGIFETFSIFIRRAALLVINQTSILQLFRKLQEPSFEEDSEDKSIVDRKTKESAETSGMLLETIAKNRPELFTPHLARLAQILVERQDDRLCRIALSALSAISLSDSGALQIDKQVLDQAYYFALNGVAVEAKYAATLLAKAPDNQDQCLELVREISNALPSSSGHRLVSHLNALKRLAKYAPLHAFQDREEDIMTFLIRQMKKVPDARKDGGDSSMEMDDKPPIHFHYDDWCSDEDFLPEHEACVIGLKIMTRRVIAHAGNSVADTMVGRIIKLMTTILQAGGRLHTFKAGPGLAGRLRLQAAISLLRLATKVQYEKLVAQNLQILAWTIQDQAFQVRIGLVHKLVAYTLNKRITSSRYTTILFLTAHDPDVENIMMAQRSIVERAKKTSPEVRMYHFDMLLVRLVHLLAHHPDFLRDASAEDLKFFVKYIELFLDCLATKDNISLLLTLAQKLKAVRDPESQMHSENLYMLSELAQYVIKSRAQLYNWPIETYPGHIKMPSDIFKALPNKEISQDIQKTVYLSSELVEGLGTVGKPVNVDVKKIRSAKPVGEKRKRSPMPKLKEKTGELRQMTRSNISLGNARKGRHKQEWEDDSDDDTAGESSSDEDLQAYEDEIAQERSSGRPVTTLQLIESVKDSDEIGKENHHEGNDQDEELPVSDKRRPANLRQRPRATSIAAVAVSTSIKSSEELSPSSIKSAGTSATKRTRRAISGNHSPASDV